MTDNFPCSGDDRSATLAANFAETLQISNTRFPLWEFEAIREKLSQSLRALGFRSWVFHVDARMRKTALRYGLVDVRDGDGEVGGSIIDLIAARESELTRPSHPPLLSMTPSSSRLMSVPLAQEAPGPLCIRTGWTSAPTRSCAR